MWIAILIVLVLIILWTIVTYNGLIRKKLKTENAWGQIDVQI